MLTIVTFTDTEGRMWYPSQSTYDMELHLAHTIWTTDAASVDSRYSVQLEVTSDLDGEHHWVACECCHKQVLRRLEFTSLITAEGVPALIDPDVDDHGAHFYGLYQTERDAILAALSLGFLFSWPDGNYCSACHSTKIDTQRPE